MSMQYLGEGNVPQPSRPELPGGFCVVGPPSSVARLPWSKATERLAQARNYWLGSTRPGGRPHTMPVWGVWFDNALYFITDRETRKSRNLLANPNVTIHLDSDESIVIIEGLAGEVHDPDLRTRMADMYTLKYGYRPDTNSGEDGEMFFVVRPRVAFTWLQSAHGKSITRWFFSQD